MKLDEEYTNNHSWYLVKLRDIYYEHITRLTSPNASEVENSIIPVSISSRYFKFSHQSKLVKQKVEAYIRRYTNEGVKRDHNFHMSNINIYLSRI